jgi:hypothetical protein
MMYRNLSYIAYHEKHYEEGIASGQKALILFQDLGE